MPWSWTSASLAVTEATGEHNLTSVGVALGTVAMAPEQASADPHMDARVDIYAVGVMGYEMLAGHTPFPGLNPQQTPAAHVTRRRFPRAQQRTSAFSRARCRHHALSRQASGGSLPDRRRAGTASSRLPPQAVG
jgi:serine/threonine protein kinase